MKTTNQRWRWVLGLLAAMWLSPAVSWAQQGRLGAGSITAASTVVNTYTALTADASAGTTTLTVANSAMTGGTFSAALSTGDLVMIIQMQGATITTTNSIAYGAVTNYNNVGLYELAEVRAVSNSTTITLGCVLANSYSAGTASTSNVRAQVVRIPRYTTLTIGASGSTTAAGIVPAAWDGATGGIVAVDVQSNVTLYTNASVDASGRGFRGGVTNGLNAAYAALGSSNPTLTTYVTTDATYSADKGESIAGYQASYTAGRYGRGAPANGGGGGNNHNAGGGGGANASTIAWNNGQGNPAASYDTSWNLENGANANNPEYTGSTFATVTSGGGGRGGYSYSTATLPANANAPGNSVWGGDYRRVLGGLGGRPLSTAANTSNALSQGNRVFLGGGGGAGHANDNVGTSGGAGGGLVYMLVGGSIVLGTTAGNPASGTAIQANGATVTGTTANDAAGGGGGGGSIILNVSGGIAANTIAANGGVGGNQSYNSNESEGPGGGGGGGYVRFTNPPSASPTANQGANGTTNSTGINNSTTGPAFPPNGATAGSVGFTGTFSYAQQCLVTADVRTVGSGPSTATVGQPIIYTLQTTNLSTTGVAATNVVPTFTLPAGVTAGQVTLPAGATLSGNVVTFATVNSLAAGQSVSNTVRYTPTAAGTVTASAANTSGQPDPTLTNNDGTAAAAQVTTVIGAAAFCASPGNDAPTTAVSATRTTSLSANPVAYYPGTASVAATTSSATITVGAAATGGAQTAIVAGDLLLIIQMQGADFNMTNTDAYGDGVAGGGANGITGANYVAGRYEYVVAGSGTSVTVASGGTITVTGGLKNAYFNQAGTTTAYQQRFQVLRVPQLGNAQLASDITVTPWNGTTGGVLALDVAGNLDFNNKTINASGAGFRGGAIFNSTIGSGTSAFAAEYVKSITTTGLKGEGLAGTPAYVNGTAATTGVSYNGGDAGRGAPGNAGGSGIRIKDAQNFENSGGAGGGNAGAGGRGGNNYTSGSDIGTSQAVGGEPGAVPTSLSVNRLVLGGGGGAGDENDNVGSGGGAGGGMVLVRAGTMNGTGTVSANGNAAVNGTNDGAGGGGAGGSVLLSVERGTMSTVTVAARGGNGGNANYSVPHGTGGGGGGGLIYANATLAASDVSGGTYGTTGSPATAWGAASGTGGAGPSGATGAVSATTFSAPANGTVGATCNDAPVAANDLATTAPGTAVTFGTTTGTTAVAGNDTDNTGGIYAPSINLDPTSATAVKTRTITGVGTFTANATTGAVTFTPVAGFVGTAEIPYVISDVYGLTSNQAIIRVTVQNPRYDLATTITSTPATGGSVGAGTLVPYSVVANNNTTGTTAANTVQTVQLQAGLTAAQLTIAGTTTNTASGVITYTSANALYNGATYTQATGVLAFPRVALANGSPQTYSFSAAAPGSGPFTTVASIGNGAPDTTPANNTASTTLSVTSSYDIGTTITAVLPANTAGPTAGDAISFVVTATDAGTTPAAGVVHTVNIGASRTQAHVTGNGYYNAAATATTVYFANGVFTTTQPASGTYLTYSVPSGFVYFPPVDLAVGQTVSNIVTFATPASGTLAPVSGFTTASLTNDTNNTNDQATASTLTVVAATPTTANTANLRTTLTATSGGSSVAPGTVAAGASIAYVATLVNDGPAAADNTQEVLSLPTGLTATTLTLTPASGTVTAATANGIITFSGTGTTSSGASYNGATYNTSTGVLTFPGAGTLSANGTAVVYNFSVTAPATNPTVQVVAMAATSTPEASLDDNVAQVMTTVNSVDVNIVLTGPTTAIAGQPVTFTATVGNVGAYAAAQVASTVSLPAGLAVATTGTTLQLNGAAPTSVNATTGVATFANGATYNPGTGLLTLPTTTSLASGTSIPYTITYLASGSGSTTNVATVRTSSPDANATNNTSSVTLTKTTAADVVASLSGPATVSVGGTVTYTATTTNYGPSAATGATVPTLQLPVGLPVNTVHPSLRVNGQLPSSVATANGVTTATYPDNSTYNQSTGVVTFPSITDQAPGAAAAVANTVTFDAPSTSNLNVVAVATPATTANDLNQDNNSAALSTPVTAPTTSADLAVTIAATSGGTAITSATAGQTVLLTVSTQNLGTSANVATTVRTQVAVAPGQPTSGANAVQVNGAAPTSVDATTGIATYADGSTYDPNTGRVVFLPAIPALGIGESRSFTVQLPAPTTGTLVAVASVRSENADPNTANNVTRTALPITTSADLTAAVTGPASTTAGAAVTYTVTTTNLAPATAGGLGGSPAVGATQTISIPANAATGTPVVTGPGAGSATITGTPATGFSIVLPLGTLGVGPASAAVNTVSFTVGTSATSPFVVTGAASTTGTGATADPVAGNNSGTAAQQQSTTLTQTGPLAADIVNNGRAGTNAGQSPIGNTGGVTPITSLAAVATGAGNNIASYTITSLPSVGVLYVNGTAITSLPAGGLSVSLANSALLSFDPTVTGPQGTAVPSTLDASNQFFTFSATDNNGAVSNVARYTVPVNQDAPAVYTVNTPKAATVVYNNGDEIARAFDYNGGRATTTAIFTPDPVTATAATSNGNSTNMPANGLASAVVNLVTNTTTNTTTTLAAAGLQINATTGRITVLDKTLLRAGTYKVNITTVDSYGGVTTQDVTFNIGSAGTGPLPVTLTTFTAQAVRNQDGLLKWTTASETDNDHFDVERSLDGTNFTKIGQVAGQGTKLTATDYTLTDAGVAAKATGLVYYRLRQVDLSGVATYSQVRTISFTDGSAMLVSVYPNPAASATTLDLRSLPATGTYQVQLLDATGRATRTWTLGGNQQQALELSNVAAGTYHVLITGLQADGSVLHQVLRLTKE